MRAQAWTVPCGFALCFLSCSSAGSRLQSACPPGTINSLLEEIRADTLNAFPPGGFAHRNITLDTTSRFIAGDGGELLVLVGVASPRYTGYYRIGLAADTAYRLRGWATCDNVLRWLEHLRIQPRQEETEVWYELWRLANALNPVGKTTRFVDPDRATGLVEASITERLARDSTRLPQIARTTEGGWTGQVTVVWSGDGYHHLDSANWIFELDSRGQFRRFIETPLDTARTN